MAEESATLVAYCGLFCGTCGAYRRGRCVGCLEGGGYSSCRVRACCVVKEYRTCADCDEYLDCKKLYNFISRIYGLVLRTDRRGNLRGIRVDGIEEWAAKAVALGRY